MEIRDLKIVTRDHPKKRNLTLAQYVKRRNGVALGYSGSFSNMLHRSFGAGTLAKFWQYWNPIWGYYLGRYIHGPLKKKDAICDGIDFNICC